MQTIHPLLEGEAKAMVVTSGRTQAVKYKLAFNNLSKMGCRIEGIGCFLGQGSR